MAELRELQVQGHSSETKAQAIDTAKSCREAEEEEAGKADHSSDQQTEQNCWQLLREMSTARA